jgi:hypothetical protein
MHGRAVVLHAKIARPPAVAINELRLRGMFGQIAHEHSRFSNGPADDCACVRREEQGFPARPLVKAHKPMTNGLEMIPFLGSEIEEADRAGRRNGPRHVKNF